MRKLLHSDHRCTASSLRFLIFLSSTHAVSCSQSITQRISPLLEFYPCSRRPGRLTWLIKGNCWYMGKWGLDALTATLCKNNLGKSCPKSAWTLSDIFGLSLKASSRDIQTCTGLHTATHTFTHSHMADSSLHISKGKLSGHWNAPAPLEQITGGRWRAIPGKKHNFLVFLKGAVNTTFFKNALLRPKLEGVSMCRGPFGQRLMLMAVSERSLASLTLL